MAITNSYQVKVINRLNQEDEVNPDGVNLSYVVSRAASLLSFESIHNLLPIVLTIQPEPLLTRTNLKPF